MANSKRLAELRNLLQAVQIELERKGPTSTPKILAAFRAQHASLLRAAAADLEEVALATLLHQVSRRTRSVKSDTQGDFFKEHPGIPVSITIPGTEDDRGRRQRKLFTKATIADVKTWLAADTARPLKKKQRHPGVAEFINEIEPFASSENSTVEDAWRAREKKRKEG